MHLRGLHRTPFLHVEDGVFGFGVEFIAGSDHTDELTDPTNPQPGCDLIVDDVVTCWA